MSDLTDLSPPAFDAELLMQLPHPIPALLKELKPQEYDLVTLSALTVISSVLPNVHTYYDQTEIRPNLYSLVVARAAAGKRKAQAGYGLISIIEQQLAKESENDTRKSNVMPSMTSPEAFLSALKANGGRGLIFSTEAATLTSTLGKEYGKGLSEILRQAYAQEAVSQHFRSTGRLHIEKPELSILLTGTPGQLGTLIQDVENGLLSRFAYYILSGRVVWNDPFADGGNSDVLKKAQDKAAHHVFKIWRRLRKRKDSLKVEVSAMSRFALGGYWSRQAEKRNQDDAETALVFRAAEREMRLAMILEVLRSGVSIENAGASIELHLESEEQAAHISEVLLEHSRIALEMVKGVDRDEAIANCKAEGMSIRAAARQLGLSKSTVHRRFNELSDE